MQTEYAGYINSFPEVFISFLEAKNNSSTVVKYIQQSIKREYDRYSYIFDSLPMYLKEDYLRIYSSLKEVPAVFEHFDDSLRFLIDSLAYYYKKDVILLIDEYDTPFIEAWVHGFYEEIHAGLSTMLTSALKGSDRLQFAFLTGIQRIARENIFSDLNNIQVYTVADQPYSGYFGFTQEETEEMLNFFRVPFTPEVKKMYDGYRIGNHEIYNPWSVSNYVHTGRILPYWVNTSSNKLIKGLLKACDKQFLAEYDRLILEGKLKTYVDFRSTFFVSKNNSALWGLFVNAGYLTIESVINLGRNLYVLTIPNEEVKEEFQSFTESCYNLQDQSINRIQDALLEKDSNAFLDAYQSLLMIPSNFDLISENSYHMFMLEISLTMTATHQILSNREAGKGRADLILKAKNPGVPSYVFEFKNTRDKAADLNKLADQGYQQMIDGMYDYQLDGQIILVSIATKGREIKMKWS